MAHLQSFGLTVDLGEERIARLRERFPELSFKVEIDPKLIPSALADVEVFVGRGRDLNLLNDFSNLQWVQTLTAGADAAPLDALVQRNVVVTNGSGIHAVNLAEHILGLMLAFARGLPYLMQAQNRREWSRNVQQFELQGQSLCVVGLGDIGIALAERASSLGMHVTGVRRRNLPAPSCIENVATLDAMDSLLVGADHVAICLPLTAHTKQLFSAQRVNSLKPGAYLYNIGRGEIVDQEAMTNALKSGNLAGAGLDVTTPEPLPADNPLWLMENVIITAHSGGLSPRRFDRFVDLLIDNIERYVNDRPLRNVVDPVAGY